MKFKKVYRITHNDGPDIVERDRTYDEIRYLPICKFFIKTAPNMWQIARYNHEMHTKLQRI